LQEIAALYALLEGLRPTPAVRFNRAFAVARASGAAEGLALIDGPDMAGIALYPYVNLVRGTLLGELGRIDEAKAPLGRAADRARNTHEREQILAKLSELAATAKGTTPGV
jgi:RNA polymerase sigma-70 factor, ECF subfamily